MSTDDVVLAEIIALAKHVSEVDSVGPNARLFSDLHLDGDVAREFMERFAGQYDVDMTNFVWLRYFGDEGFDMMGPAFAMAASVLSTDFALRWHQAREAEREITIEHLVDVARTRVWRDPGVEFRMPPTQSVVMLAFSAVSVLVTAFFLLLGIAVIYGFLTGELGDGGLLTLFGIAAVSIFFPAYLAFGSWRNIERKLASAP